MIALTVLLGYQCMVNVVYCVHDVNYVWSLLGNYHFSFCLEVDFESVNALVNLLNRLKLLSAEKLFL